MYITEDYPRSTQSERVCIKNKSQLNDEMMSIFFNLQSIKLIMNYTTFSPSLFHSLTPECTQSSEYARYSRWEWNIRPVMFRTLYYISRVIRLTLKQLHKADLMFNNSETNENCNKIYYQKNIPLFTLFFAEC